MCVCVCVCVCERWYGTKRAGHNEWTLAQDSKFLSAAIETWSCYRTVEFRLDYVQRSPLGGD